MFANEGVRLDDVRFAQLKPRATHRTRVVIRAPAFDAVRVKHVVAFRLGETAGAALLQANRAFVLQHPMFVMPARESIAPEREV